MFGSTFIKKKQIGVVPLLVGSFSNDDGNGNKNVNCRGNNCEGLEVCMRMIVGEEEECKEE